MQLEQIVLGVPAVLIGLTIHEYSHGLTALWCGDTTARDSGRLTLNPISHLDPIGTVMMVLSMMQFFPIGWAKPVPIDPRRFRQPKRDLIFVSVAGPLSNIFCAIAFGFLLITLNTLHYNNGYADQFIQMAIMVNLSLAVFNILPLYPLDGSKVVIGLLPNHLIPGFVKYSQFAAIGLLLLMVLGKSSIILSPFYNLIFKSYLSFMNLFS
jgi:Zn-dependent protease